MPNRDRLPEYSLAASGTRFICVCAKHLHLFI